MVLQTTTRSVHSDHISFQFKSCQTTTRAEKKERKEKEKRERRKKETMNRSTHDSQFSPRNGLPSDTSATLLSTRGYGAATTIGSGFYNPVVDHYQEHSHREDQGVLKSVDAKGCKLPAE